MARLSFRAAPNQTFILPRDIAAQIEAHCHITGDNPIDVLCDAVKLHFDALDGEGAEHEPYVVPVDDDGFATQVADTVQP